MSRAAAFIGIDFGSARSRMACASSSGRLQILRSAEGRDYTPSVVWFDNEQLVVGEAAEQAFRRPDQRARVLIGMKRHLASSAVFAVPGGGRIRPVEAVAAILAKLKHDAEQTHFGGSVTRAVLTCPASFRAAQREALQQAARLAGFQVTQLLDEPVAAALAYQAERLRGTRQLPPMLSKRVLVISVGAAVCEVSLLARDGATYRLDREPQTLADVGGDACDWAVYSHCDAYAQRTLGRPIGADPKFLLDCRAWKQKLTSDTQVNCAADLAAGPAGADRFEMTLDRTTFDRLIQEQVERIVRLAKAVLNEAVQANSTPASVLLVGEASRLPLLRQQLAKMELAPFDDPQPEAAVALGAADLANRVWGAELTRSAATSGGDLFQRFEQYVRE